jgi:hypothetical protein
MGLGNLPIEFPEDFLCGLKPILFHNTWGKLLPLVGCCPYFDEWTPGFVLVMTDSVRSS